MIIYSFYRVYEPSTYSTDSSEDDHINCRKVYEVKSSGSAKLSTVRDGHNWKKDSGTQWCGFSKVRYSDCASSYKCTNPDCDFKREYGVVIMDKKWFSNQKQKIKDSNQPHDHNFEAVAHFKQYPDQTDPYYVYTMNDLHGNPSKPFHVLNQVN